MKTHGCSKTRLFEVWDSMKDRCNKPAHRAYARYGGRGIRVCAEWDNDFACFKEWAEKSGYKEGLSLDRIDNNGNYEPSNCRWATRQEQANNRCSNRYVTINGVTKTCAEWYRGAGISKELFHARLRVGVTGDALLLPPGGLDGKNCGVTKPWRYQKLMDEGEDE